MTAPLTRDANQAAFKALYFLPLTPMSLDEFFYSHLEEASREPKDCQAEAYARELVDACRLVLNEHRLGLASLPPPTVRALETVIEDATNSAPRWLRNGL